MGDILSAKDANLLSINRLSQMTGMNRETVTRRIAGVTPAGKINGFPAYSLKDVGPALFADTSPCIGEDFDPARLPPKERLDWYRSERERMKMQAEDRELIPASEVEQVIATALAALAQGLRATPDHLERRYGISAEVAVAVGEAIDIELDALADRLMTLSPDTLIDESTD